MAGNRSETWDPNTMIEPEILLPEQLDKLSAEDRTGEFSLLWAVFADGIQTYCREILRGSTRSLAYREVERWIFRPNSDAVTSFSSLAELFGVDPRRLRRALMHFREHPNTKLMELFSQKAA